MKDLPTHYEFTSEQAYDEKDLNLNFECHILQVLVTPPSLSSPSGYSLRYALKTGDLKSSLI